MINLLEKDKKYILGLSGGADSVFLFFKLIESGINNFVACHVNYNFRSDSDTDLKIVKKICKENKIKLKVKNIYQNYEILKDNFESWARNQRYDFFCKVLEKEKASAILIAHNLNDHVETYLMQKESNKMVSYFGIRQESSFKNKKILRPIMHIKKSYIVNFLKSKEIIYTNDSTNSDIKYKRNFIRVRLDEQDFEKYLSEISTLNKKNLFYEKKIKWVPLQKNLNLAYLNKDDKWNKYLIFKFLETNGFSDIIYFSKKAFLNELIKQLSSEKSLIEIKKKNFILMKDYCFLRILKNNDIRTYEIESFDKKEFLEKAQKINLNLKQNLVITNNWKKYQSELKLNGKTLSQIYKNKKIPYIQRYKKVLVFDKTKKIVLNNITI